MFSDLHLHSTYSDGRLTPSELVHKSIEIGLKYIALSDHDCLDGIEEAVRAAKGSSLVIIPAVEFSCVIEDGRKEIHIIGYIKDYKNKKLRNLLKYFAEARTERARGIVGKLAALGIGIDFESVKEIAGYGTVGRPHIARAIVKTGAVKNVWQAFEQYLSEGAPAYLPKAAFSVDAAISAIHNSGGLAIWAHPPMEILRNHIEYYKSVGLDGIEAFHPLLASRDRRKAKRIAQKNNLFVTGGSDWHSIERDGPFGSYRIKSEDISEFLEAYLRTS
jgi:predicted metal-dependent phosphoesterase TrpH